MKTCKHIRSKDDKSFVCKDCQVVFCKSCVKETLCMKQCGSCGMTYPKDDLNATNCTKCKRCPLCKVIVTLPEKEEGNSDEFVRERILRGRKCCKSRNGGNLLSEATYRNILKIKGLIMTYCSYEAAGDTLANYWHCQCPAALTTSAAQEVSELDNCVEYLAAKKFDIDQLAPLKQRLQVPCRQDELTCQLAPVAVLLQPMFRYYCPRCDNKVALLTE